MSATTKAVVVVPPPAIEDNSASVLDSSDETKSSEQWHCPQRHVMEFEIEQYEGSTCDICNYSFRIGDKSLVCWACQGYCVCIHCKEKSQEPSITITSADHYNRGVELFEKTNYIGAVEEFKQCLHIRKSLVEQKMIPSSQAAICAEILAKAQHLAGNISIAMETCTMAVKYWEDSCSVSPEACQEDSIRAQKLFGDMKHLQETTMLEKSKSITTQPKHPTQKESKLLGVSVYHLQTTFLAHVRVANLDENSNIHKIENLQGPPGVIRRRGANVVCPVDGKMGAAYVNCLEGEDNVGEATHMLSYSWSYKIGDIVDSLTDYCGATGRDPKRTYVWICCLCINQHRVVQQKECGGTGMLNFEEEFPRKLKKIGHMLAMMAPWQAPFYLTRLWCVFEMYAAHANGCKVDIVMPPKEKESLEQDVIRNEGGIDALYEALGNTDVQNADATVQSDKKIILGMIESTVGCQVLNNEVNNLLRAWMKQVLIQLVEKRDDTNDGAYATNCSWVGLILYKNGEYDAALEQYQKCLAIREVLLGTDHADTATTHNSIGLVLHSRGDYDGALEEYRKCLVIKEAVLGTKHPEIATTYNNIGNLLNNKGDYDGALREFRKCLAIEEAVLGGDHPNTATTYNSIGSVLYNKDDYDGALVEYRKCLAIRESVFGTDHPSTATIYNNIGNALADDFDYDGALEEYRKCLAIRESVLGTDHPSTATTHCNIGNVLENKGDYDGALEEYRKCLAIEEAVLGNKHPSIATTYSCIGSVLDDKGDYDGALLHFNKCLAIQEAELGRDHPDTLITYNSIASLMDNMNQGFSWD